MTANKKCTYSFKILGICWLLCVSLYDQLHCPTANLQNKSCKAVNTFKMQFFINSYSCYGNTASLGGKYVDKLKYYRQISKLSCHNCTALGKNRLSSKLYRPTKHNEAKCVTEIYPWISMLHNQTR